MERTVVTALKGGHLRRLRITGSVQKPCAIRKLLPSFVAVELDLHNGEISGKKDWQEGANQLRPALGHITNRRDKAAPSTAGNRLLTCKDVQGMRRHFKDGGAPRYDEFEYGKSSVPFEDVQLAWLKKDAKLAQQVADAWNDVVSQGVWRRASAGRARTTLLEEAGLCML